MSGRQIAIDHRVLKDEKIAEETLSLLLKTREELDDLIENLEILANQELVGSIKESERAKERGKTKRYSVEEIKEELQLSDGDLQETEDIDFE